MFELLVGLALGLVVGAILVVAYNELSREVDRINARLYQYFGNLRDEINAIKKQLNEGPKTQA